MLLRRWGFLIAAGAFALAPLAPAESGASRIVTPDEHGPVTAIVLNAEGGGWFTTGKADGTAYLNLMQIKNGVPSLTHGDPANEHKGIKQMAMTPDGSTGWAVGVEDEAGSPLLWRLNGGRWGPAPHKLAPSVELTDVALSGDGHDGWLTGRDRRTGEPLLMRLRNGAWAAAPSPPNSILTRISISADGSTGWGLGMTRRSPQEPRLFRLSGGRWSLAADNPFPKGYIGKQVTASDAGDGWAIAGPARAGSAPDVLMRLPRNGKARVVPVSTPLTGISPQPPLSLAELGVDWRGVGWAAGSLYLYSVGDAESGPTSNYHQPVLVRLRGDSAVSVPPESAGIVGHPSYYGGKVLFRPTELALGPGGAQAMLGGIGDYGNQGTLQQLHEPWPYLQPSAAPALYGAGRCFSETLYCLRGVFARAWEQGGGVGRFGYPLTTEVTEDVLFYVGNDFKTETLTVQYTERARFEYNCAQHPCTVMQGRLGWEAFLLIRDKADANGQYYGRWLDPARDKDRPGWVWFPQTQHNLGAPFLDYWTATGGIATHGYPITEPFHERLADGNLYYVQYFERSRLEYHSENRGTSSEVMLGRIGAEVFRDKHRFLP